MELLSRMIGDCVLIFVPLLTRKKWPHHIPGWAFAGHYQYSRADTGKHFSLRCIRNYRWVTLMLGIARYSHHRSFHRGILVCICRFNDTFF